jgi:DNA ligase (NAD+)
VGTHIAKVLAQHYGSLEKIQNASKEELQAIYEIGSEIAASVENFFQEERNLQVIQHMQNLGVRIEEVDIVAEELLQPLAGKSLVLTGTLEGMTREEAKQRIESLGGRVMSSVSKQTDYVVAGTEPGSKLEKAEKLRVQVLDEAKFRSLLSENKTTNS